MLTERRRDRLEHLYTRLALRAEARVSEAREKLKTVSRTLEAMNPENVLARGYAIVTKGGAAVRSSAQVAGGDVVAIRFASGMADAQILSSQSEEA